MLSTLFGFVCGRHCLTFAQLCFCPALRQGDNDLPLPTNRVCTNSTVIESVPFDDHGSTFLVDPVGEENIDPVCSPITSSSKGAWYLVQGDGCRYTASTEGSAFDAVLAVYFTFSGCESLFCHSNNNGLTSEISWKTTPGVEFYLFVAGLNGDTGTYNLTVTVRWVAHVYFASEDLVSPLFLSLRYLSTGRRLPTGPSEQCLRERHSCSGI